MYSGITPSCTGTSIVAMTSASSRSAAELHLCEREPGQRAEEDDGDVTVVATIVVFSSAVQKLTLTSPELKTRVMLCQSSWPGVSTGG